MYILNMDNNLTYDEMMWYYEEEYIKMIMTNSNETL